MVLIVHTRRSHHAVLSRSRAGGAFHAAVAGGARRGNGQKWGERAAAGGRYERGGGDCFQHGLFRPPAGRHRAALRQQ
eukprot:261884-Pyramimonas_sp.AAC.1